MKNKKRFLAIALTAAMLTGSLSACGGDSDTTSTGGDDTASTTSTLEVDESKVTLWLFAETHANYFEWVTEQYTNENPDVQFDIQVMETTAMNDRLAVITTAGGEGTPDFMDIEKSQFPIYMNENRMIFEPLNEWMERDGITEKMVDTRNQIYSWNGNYYGLEHALCPVTMAYRPDLFEQAGVEVPTTWDEYKAAAEALSEQGIYIAAQGDIFSGFPIDDVDLYLKASGNYYVNEDGTTNIVGNEALKTLLDDYKQMQEDGLILPVETDEDRWNAIAADQIATYYTPDWGAGWLRDNVPEQSGMWEMTYIPQFDENSVRVSCNGGTGFCMSSFTKKDKEMLWDFMKYAMVEPENCAEKYELVNLYPPVYDAMELCNGPVEYYNNQNLGEMYTEIAPDMPLEPQAMWKNKFNEVMGTYGYDWANGDMTTDEYLQAVQDDVDAYIAEMG